jgi:hypothetical protein
MNIRDAILEEHSKEQTAKIVDYVGDDPDRFAELMSLMLGPVYRLSQRASWPISNCIERHPHLIQPYWSKLAGQLDRDDAHIAVRRNVARLMQFVEIPKRHQGRIFDACYRLAADVSQPVAVRCFSTTVAANIAKGNPELMNELKMAVTAHPEKDTPGTRARFRMVFGK